MDRRKYSEEQQKIIDDTEHNIIVNAVAGSGKTTTIAGICMRDPSKRVLVLTYSRQLANSTIGLFQESDIKNIHIHTFHSVLSRWSVCKTDDDAKRLLRCKVLENRYVKYDIIVMDEVQDMYETTYRIVRMIIQHNVVSNPQLIVLGDVKQNIYSGMTNSDGRYLTLADQIFPSKRKWMSYPLSTSYRCPEVICQYMQNTVDKIPMNSHNKKEGMIKYIEYRDAFCCANIVIELLGKLFEEGYKPTDIFILLPSTSTNSISGNANQGKHKLISLLVELIKTDFGNMFDIVSVGSGNETSKEFTENKLIISTIHGSKGSERKIVFLMKFDDSFHEYYDDDRTLTIPNVIYVAMTRASHRLYLFRQSGKQLMPSVTLENAKMLGACISEGKVKCKEKKNVLSVTEYIKHLDCETLSEINSICDVEEMCIGDGVSFVGATEARGCKENVSVLNGLMIEVIDEYIKCRGQKTIKEICALTKDRYMVNGGHRYVIDQMVDEQWLPSDEQIEFVRLLFESLIGVLGVRDISRQIDVEGVIARKIVRDYDVIRTEMDKIKGRVDWFCENYIIELKYIGGVTIKEMLQPIIYSTMRRELDLGSESCHPRIPVLFNLATGKAYIIKNPKECVDHISSVEFEVPRDNSVFITRCRTSTFPGVDTHQVMEIPDE